MKNILIYIGLVLVLFSCNNEDAPDCLQTTGTIISREVEVGNFSKIIVEDAISVVIKQAPQQKVTVETGENLFSDIYLEVKNQTLFLQDKSGCNWFRDYGVTTVYIETPNLTFIRNASVGSIASNGLLSFANLDLISNTEAGVDNANKSGDFNLQLDCERLSISANGLSIFTLSGTADRAFISFTDEAPRLEGENLVINKLTVLQRSATYMKVFPVEAISGEIRGTGDVIAVHRPPMVDVTQYYTGELIFLD